ncbi:MAG TPA: carboxymuconolactone decarboxylase family protein [Caulobacteraceae bacterium]|jgi:AhpD family alkylhydroperoxidase
MRNPAIVLPDVLPASHRLEKIIDSSGLSKLMLNLAYLRVSQINGCSFCVDMHSRDLKKGGESDERIWAVGAWRESPHFNDAERAALALTEAATRLNDRPDPVPDEVWNQAARHFDERALAALVVGIGVINFWNRINVTIRQVADARLAAQATRDQAHAAE